MTHKTRPRKKHIRRTPPPTQFYDRSYGTRSELLASADLFTRGVLVYRAMASVGIDLVILIPPEMRPLRVEVRSGRKREDGSITYNGFSKEKKKHFDLLAVVTRERDVYYYGPAAQEIYDLPVPHDRIHTPRRPMATIDTPNDVS